MASVNGVKAFEYGGLEFVVGRVIASVEAVLFDELPEPFNQVEIG